METKKVFSEYLSKNENKKGQVSYNYSIAINRMSKHYSDEKNERFDFYDEMPIDLFESIVKLYNKGGQYEKEGDYGNGTNRAAINALLRFKKYASEHGIDHLIESANVDTDLEIGEIIEKEDVLSRRTSELLSYESDLKRLVIEKVDVLFPGYEIFGGVENGVEYPIKNKRIDILLSNKDGDFLIVELKAVKAKYDVFGQVSMYLGLIQDKFPNNKVSACIIANEIDKSLEYATKTNPKVILKTFSLQLSLLDY